ncbi:hypothetical protein ACLOJK_011075 [Asimina triloba]
MAEAIVDLVALDPEAEMMNGKLVITYKRKRLSSRHELAQGIKLTSMPSELSTSTQPISDPKSESSLEFLSEKLEGEDQRCISHDKQLCSDCKEQCNSGKSLQPVHEPRTGMEHRFTDGSEMGPIRLCSHKVLLAPNSCGSVSTEGKDCSPKEDASAEMKASSKRMESSSDANYKSECKVEHIERHRVSQVADMDDAKTPVSGLANSLIETKFGAVCQDPILKTQTSGINNPSQEANSALLPGNVLPKRFSDPLITFSRRARKKEHVGADIKDSSEANTFSLVKLNSCEASVGSLDEVASQCNSVHQSSAVIALRECLQKSPLILQKEAEIKEIMEIMNHEVDGRSESTHAASALEAEIAVPAHDAMQEPKTCIGVVSGTITDAVAEFDETTSELASKDHVKLSAAPPVPHCVSDLNVQMSANSPTTSDSLPSDAKSSHIAANSHEVNYSNPSVDVTASPEHAIVLHEKASQESKGLEFVEILDGVEKSTDHQDKDGSNVLPSLNENCMNYKQNCDREILNEAIPLAYMPREGTTCLGFQGRNCLPQSGLEKNLWKQTPTKSSSCPHFLGLSLPTKPDAVKDCQSRLSPTSLRIKSSSHVHDHQLGLQDVLPQSPSDNSPSLARHKQLLENIMTRAEMLRRNQGFSWDKFKGHVNAWSEEELDYLWIGVRRCGRGNWDAMLRDPKLHFAEGRAAEDLAVRWDEEQSKLLSGTLIQPVVFSTKPDRFHAVSTCLSRPVIGSHYGSYGSEHHTPRCQAFTAETELSLGDVYTQKDDNVRRRYPFHLPGPALALPLSRNYDQDINPYLMNGMKIGAKQQKPFKAQRSHSYSSRKRVRYDNGFPFMQQNPMDGARGHVQWSREMLSYSRNVSNLNDSASNHGLPTGLPAAGNLPHWLREVFGRPQRPTEPVLPPGVSAIAHSVSVLYNDNSVIPSFSAPGVAPVPPKDPREQVPRRKTNTTSRITGLSCMRSPETTASAMPAAATASCSSLTWMETKLDFHPIGPSSLKPTMESQVLDQKDATDLNQPLSDPFPQNDLVVIDSDASSEETISDDQSGRH